MTFHNQNVELFAMKILKRNAQKVFERYKLCRIL